jgi:hypothetical protein
MEDIHEPVARFEGEFRTEHARHTAEMFEELVRRAGVDEALNAATVAEHRTLEAGNAEADATLLQWKALRVVLVAAAVGCGWYAWQTEAWGWLLGTAASLGVVFGRLNAIIAGAVGRLEEGRRAAAEKLREAWGQLEPLNRLYEWDFCARLLRRTVPRIELDPYFTRARLAELQDAFGWSDRFNEERSVRFAHSGVLNGNPFIVARLLRHWMGEKTYHGSLSISWVETVRDANGRWRTETRHQTLHAPVTKPHPEYGDDTVIVYGNEAAPNLNFSRQPTGLSRMEGGLWERLRIWWVVRRLEAKARNPGAGSRFTLLANREFEALFGASDRDHEVQFRLLFTALAQQEMVKLLRDRKVGYGDNFSFVKKRMINVLQPAHLSPLDLSADPALFRRHDLAEARRFFRTYHAELFRGLYFGLAPLLAVPLYQQHRSHADIYRDAKGRRPCFWEHESIANHFGEERFQHPACRTRSLLKTAAREGSEGLEMIEVSARGYGGTDRTDCVSVFGGDGRWHQVPVPWVDYFPVSRESRLAVAEGELPAPGTELSPDAATTAQERLRRSGVDPAAGIRRRSLLSALLPS